MTSLNVQMNVSLAFNDVSLLLDISNFSRLNYTDRRFSSLANYKYIDIASDKKMMFLQPKDIYYTVVMNVI